MLRGLRIQEKRGLPKLERAVPACRLFICNEFHSGASKGYGF
jgi:hypothetical protein